MILKAEFHSHTSDDPEEPAELSAFELIDLAARLGYKVLSITNHNLVTYSDEMKAHALRRGIVLLPGAEVSVDGRKHVLIINTRLRGNEPAFRVRTFGDLAAIKDDETLLIAPHPFHKAPVCLGRSLEEHRALFDAIESSHFYSHRINLNSRAQEFARKHNLPLVGTSDAHFKFQFGRAYSLVEAEADPASIVRAVKKGRVICVCPPMTVFGMAYVIMRMCAASFAHAVRRRQFLGFGYRREGGSI